MRVLWNLKELLSDYLILDNAVDSTRYATMRRVVLQKHPKSLKICAWSIFVGYRIKLHRAVRASAGSQTQERHTTLLGFLSTVIKNPCAYSWLSIKTDKKKKACHLAFTYPLWKHKNLKHKWPNHQNLSHQAPGGVWSRVEDGTKPCCSQGATLPCPVESTI